jgi:hypothetical protein
MFIIWHFFFSFLLSGDRNRGFCCGGDFFLLITFINHSGNFFFLISKNCIYQKPKRGHNQIHMGYTTKNKRHNTAYKRERLDTKGTPKLTRSSPSKPPSPKHPKPNPIQPKNYTESILPFDPGHAIDKLSLSFISVSQATFRASSSSSTFHPPFACNHT